MKSILWHIIALASMVGLPGLILCGQARAQEAGFFKASAGSIPIIALSDAQGTLGASLLRDAAPEAIEAALALGGLPAGSGGFPSWVNAFVVELPQGLVLIDTGNGPQAGLAKSLAAAGLSPDDIKFVLLTHFHGDHIGGLLDATGGAAFKNAVVYANAAEDAYWLRTNPSKQAKRALAPYKAGGSYKTFQPGEEVLPGVLAMELYGHTPGHTGFLFTGGGEKPLLVWGDIVHARLIQFDHPEISLTYDTDRRKAVPTRQRIFEEAAKEGYLIAGAHLPFPGLGSVTKGEGGSYGYQPLEAK